MESLHFPGQTHRWQVSGWLQKGCEKAHNSLLDDVALALSLIVVTAKNRLSSPLFSLSHSLQSVWQGILMLVGKCCCVSVIYFIFVFFCELFSFSMAVMY